MDLKVTNIDIAYDPILNEAILSDVNQEVGFIREEVSTIISETKLFQAFDDHIKYDEGIGEAEKFCEGGLGTGSYTDCDPHNSRMEPYENCNGLGFIKDINE